MKKTLSLALACILMLAILVGCAGTTVVINECTCPEGHEPEATQPTQPTQTEPTITGEGAVKTGLSITTSVSDSTSATAEADGAVKYDITLAAVTVDDNGVITSCYIDSLQAKVSFDAAGTITSDVSAFATKNELGDSYGMKAWGGAAYEWNEQAASFAAYVTGKTAAEVAGIAVNEKTAPADADLSSTVTIAIGGFQALIAKAVQ